MILGNGLRITIHHKECWINCKRGKIQDDDVLYYVDAVYTALPFGLIRHMVKRMVLDFRNSLPEEKTAIGARLDSD